MRKVLLILLAAALYHAEYAQTGSKQFMLKGKLQGQQDGMLYLSYTGSDNKRVKDSAIIQHDGFFFAGNIAGPTMAYLELKQETGNEANGVNIFLEPVVMAINVILNDFRNAAVAGSHTQDEYAWLAQSKKPIEAKYKKQRDSLRTEQDHDIKAGIRERLAPYFKELDQADVAFFKKHPSSCVTAYMLRFHVNDLSLAELRQYYNALGPGLQQTSDGKDLAAEIQNLQWGSPGSMARNFTTTDIEGKELSLSDYKGKYVLLDFWASWCVPCRKGNPHLKELYARYKDKGIAFIGVSDDDRSQDAWKKAVEKDGLPWKQVLRSLRYGNDQYMRSTDILEIFGIHSLPTKILIDPSGKIIGRYDSEGDEMDKKLAEIF